MEATNILTTATANCRNCGMAIKQLDTGPLAGTWATVRGTTTCGEGVTPVFAHQPSTGEVFYAVSPNRSGVYGFACIADVQRWVRKNAGERIDAAQVDPDIRREAGEQL